MASRQRDTSDLHAAARCGDLAAVTRLIRDGAHVDARDTDGWTPLRVAAMKGHWEIATVLLQAGAEADILIAAALGDQAIAARPLDASAQSSAEPDPLNQGRTALHVAATREIAKL